MNKIDKEFPIDVFPEIIRKYVIAGHHTLNFPLDYLCAGILFTTSVLIGNTTKLKVKNGWLESTILYMALVGRKGLNKSHPLDFIMKPIRQKDEEYANNHKKNLKIYHALSDEEKKRTSEPIQQQLLINDITPETIIQVLHNNPRGIGYYKDELTAWLNDFNRYHKGSEEQFWLSTFSNKFIRVNRINRPTITINSPFVSVIGSIQPKILNELFAEKRIENGFTDRILFVFPSQIVKPYWQEAEMSDELVEQYGKVMSRFFNLDLKTDEFGNVQPNEISFSLEAKKLFVDWFNRNVDEYNHPNTPLDILGIISKSDILCARLCTILQGLNDMVHEAPFQEISTKSVQGAVRLIEYFKQQAKKAHLYAKENKLGKQPKERTLFYEKLPISFTRKQANEIAVTLEIHLKTAEKHLEYFLREKLLNKPKHNLYQKST